MLWKALAVICAGADCCFWRFAERGVWAGSPAVCVNDYAQLWLGLGVGLGGVWGFALKANL